MHNNQQLPTITRYEVEMLKDAKDDCSKKTWTVVWVGTATTCEIGDLKRGTTACFRLCQNNYEGKKGKYSATLKVGIRRVFRNAWSKKKKKEREEVGVILVEDVAQVEAQVEEPPPPSAEQKDEESWTECYNQRSGGFYWQSSSGKIQAELPAGVTCNVD